MARLAKVAAVTASSIALMLGLASCAPTPLEVYKLQEVEGSSGTVISRDSTRPSYVIGNDGSIHFTLGGSGSCKPQIDRFEVQGNTLLVHQKAEVEHERLCTMDFKVYEYQLSNPTDPEFPGSINSVSWCQPATDECAELQNVG